MSEAERLVDQFKRAHDGDPWHGSPLKRILRGVTATQAATRPRKGGHSIWELVVHLTAWRNEVAERATGKPAAAPSSGDWPKIGEPTPARWKAALAALDASHEHVLKVTRELSDDRLLTPTNDPRNRPLGTGVSYYELLHGAVQHDAYHAGQIAILKKVLGFVGVPRASATTG
jgi:uncharacterized damage-inducible protein DinB